VIFHQVILNQENLEKHLDGREKEDFNKEKIKKKFQVDREVIVSVQKEITK
jgi:hypothetical protein